MSDATSWLCGQHTDKEIEFAEVLTSQKKEEIARALADKDAEIERLKAELETYKRQQAEDQAQLRDWHQLVQRAKLDCEHQFNIVTQPDGSSVIGRCVKCGKLYGPGVNLGP